MEHISSILDRVYTDLEGKNTKLMNHEILSLETAQRLADYEKLKKLIRNTIKTERSKLSNKTKYIESEKIMYALDILERLIDKDDA